jgi:voltage-gated potassium channel
LSNWLTLIALAVPALRIFRVFRALRLLRLARTTRGLKLLRIVASVNRGMRVLGATLGRRGFGYVLALTLIVLFAGAAGMYAFEQNPGGRGLNSYGTALWWTAMVLSTMGSEYWPQTPEGRMLCILLALYAFTMFGYVTATLASVFVNFDAESDESQLAGSRSIEQLRQELAALREDIRSLGAKGS